MTTVFIGGSRDITRLPAELKQRLDTVMEQGHHVILGDANGADKAVQKHLADRHYKAVTVFCSGDAPRNNVGDWTVRGIVAEAKTAKDYQFYAAKDREMAREADFGLMIWDGKSPGTLLNLVRLLQADKIAVLYHLPRKEILNFKTAGQLRGFINQCEDTVRSDIQKRATTAEKGFLADEGFQPSLLDSPSTIEPSQTAIDDQASLTALNAALASGDMRQVADALGSLARLKGMSHVARDTGLARESLYRSLDAGGNPEFATILKVLASIGITLEARSAKDSPHER